MKIVTLSRSSSRASDADLEDRGKPMRIERSRRRRATKLSCLLALAQLLVSMVALAETGPRWMGPNGVLLPFETEDEILEFLQKARVTSQRVIPQGINQPIKLGLELDGIKAHGVFRFAEISKKSVTIRGKRFPMFMDSYAFECGAYELSRLLGIETIPPCTGRKLRGIEGTIQLWVEDAMTELRRREENLEFPQPAYRAQQHQAMRVFDALIYNFDRNLGNILIDPEWKIWLIDHTRSFAFFNEIKSAGKLVWVDRILWERLQKLSKEETRKALSPWVDRPRINAMFKRRDKIVAHFEKRIADLGAESVVLEPGQLGGRSKDDVDLSDLTDSSPPVEILLGGTSGSG